MIEALASRVRDTAMAFPSDNGFGPLWSSDNACEPLKVAVEDEGEPKCRSEVGYPAEKAGVVPPPGLVSSTETQAAAFSPIGPPSSAAAAARLAAATDDKGPLERRVAVLEEENRALRAALASLQDIGASMLRSLAGENPQASDQSGAAAPVAAAAAKLSPAPTSPELNADTGPAKVGEVEIPAPVTFSFSIRKADNTDLGLDVASIENQPGLLVERILPGGAAEAWNRQQDPGSSSARDLRRGDTILKVNMAEGDPELMLSECRNKQLLKLVVRRAAAEMSPAVPESPPPEKILTFSPALSATTADSQRTPPATEWSSPVWLPTPACMMERPTSASAHRRVLVL